MNQTSYRNRTDQNQSMQGRLGVRSRYHDLSFSRTLISKLILMIVMAVCPGTLGLASEVDLNRLVPSFEPKFKDSTLMDSDVVKKDMEARRALDTRWSETGNPLQRATELDATRDALLDETEMLSRRANGSGGFIPQSPFIRGHRAVGAPTP